MTIAYTVLTNFRTDLYARLESMTPNMEIPIGFTPRSLGAVATSEIDDLTSQPRLCELRKPLFKRYEWFGKGTNASRWTVPLQIIYPDTYEWRAIAVDDAMQITDDLRESPLSTSGVALCNIDPEVGPTFEDLSDGDWFKMTIPLLTIIEESS